MSGICTRVFLPAMMIVEMGNQMKDLHTLLHYLPIIRNLTFFILTTSMGCCLYVNCFYHQHYLRKAIQYA
jgi:hypothetical protein